MNKKSKTGEDFYNTFSDSESEELTVASVSTNLDREESSSSLNSNRDENESLITIISQENEDNLPKPTSRESSWVWNGKIGNIQSTVDKFATKPYAKTDKRNQQLTNTIVDFIVCCQLPFAIVDNSYFVTMLNTFDGCCYIVKYHVNRS
ncbi:hypothetical protein Glove_120g117 [Diversispora epigaea]|uniref:Uncharacterized protein n=1 Tax=Diversispora epigaea TaxID=1348612 RepID=A0A397IZT9_9GLOM|nr:hypothetical protein Glove_120g117 [Diversispora epigaea]